MAFDQLAHGKKLFPAIRTHPVNRVVKRFFHQFVAMLANLHDKTPRLARFGRRTRIWTSPGIFHYTL